MVDIDDLSDLALDHDVQAVPTVVAVKDGQVCSLTNVDFEKKNWAVAYKNFYQKQAISTFKTV